MVVQEICVNQLRFVPNFWNLVAAYQRCDNRVESAHGKPFDLSSYEVLEDCGQLRTALLLNECGWAVGVVSIQCMPDAHAQQFVCYCDNLFCLPEYRRKGGGKLLIQKADEFAKDFGCKGMLLSAQYGSRLAQVYSKLYKPMDVIFYKAIGA